MPSQPDSVAIPNNDQDIWGCYAKKIKSQIVGEGKLGSNERLYICPPAEVFGGSRDAAPEVFNLSIYSLCNTLMRPDTVFRTPADDYVQRLARWIDFIAPDTPNPNLEIKVRKASDEVVAAKIKYTEEESTASNDYTEYKAQCKTDNVTADELTAWRAVNAPGYTSAHKKWVNATQTLEGLRAGLYGDLLGKITQRLSYAQDSDKLYPGITMPVTSSLATIQSPATQGNIYYRPLSDLVGFWGALANANKLKLDDPPQTSWKLTAEEGSNFSWSNLNQSSDATKSAGAEWLVVSTSSSSSETRQSDSALSKVLDKMTFTLSFKALQTFNVTPGGWFASLDTYNLKTGANVEPLVVPSKVLVGFGPSMQVDFQDEAKDAFDKEYQEYKKSDNANLSVFGISVTGSQSSGKQTSAGDSHYDKSTGLAINPPKDMYPVLLGVYGSVEMFPTAKKPAPKPTS